MELFYTQVSEGMRSLGTSFYLLTMAIGTYLASALNIIVAAASPRDLWVADNPLFGHYDWYFWCVVRTATSAGALCGQQTI
jgi:peptide/histidine transporter 3/4